MAEKIAYLQIADVINSQAKAFKFFLQSVVLDKVTFHAVKLLASQNEVFIFSGIIRDFLTGDIESVRDFDCVIKNMSMSNINVGYLRESDYKLNSFGGLKIKRRNLVIDIWRLKDTWGIREMKAKLNPNSLIASAFFNFSAIVYDFNKEKFIFDKNFCIFLATKTMDVVYGKNPNIPLCLVNIYHYNRKYLFAISLKMAGWVKAHYHHGMNFIPVQMKHFGAVLYKQDDIESFLTEIIEKYDVQN